VVEKNKRRGDSGPRKDAFSLFQPFRNKVTEPTNLPETNRREFLCNRAANTHRAYSYGQWEEHLRYSASGGASSFG